MCRKTSIEKFNYLCTVMTRDKKGCKYRIFTESKNTHTESIPESEAF